MKPKPQPKPKPTVLNRLLGSVRARAALAATLVVAVALVAAGAAVLIALRTNLTGEADATADASARRIAATLLTARGKDALDLDDSDRPAQIVTDDGRLLAATEDLERITGTATAAVRPQSPPTEEDDDDREPGGEADARTRYADGTATVDGDTAAYRFAAVEVDDSPYGDVTVYAGAPLAAERGAVTTTSRAMLIGFPLLLVVVAAVTWLVTRRALRPVEGIRAEMAAITASRDLGRRVPVPATHDEVARLARTTNETLAALEDSVERQRRFVADASHELRSPIASLRTQLEVGAAHPALLDVPGAVADTVRLQELAADLLLLARLDAGERPGSAVVDLAALVREELSQRAGDRVPVAVSAPGQDPARVTGSRGQLARVVTNLVDNAQRHARAGVRVSVEGAPGGVRLAVADDGEGVPEAERERIFERFVRLDAARSRDGGGAGLGLAIARDVAERHGGTLTVRTAPEGGAQFTLTLPAGSAQPAG
jgi:signal transduction histidine kinase